MVVLELRLVIIAGDQELITLPMAIIMKNLIVMYAMEEDIIVVAGVMVLVMSKSDASHRSYFRLEMHK